MINTSSITILLVSILFIYFLRNRIDLFGIYIFLVPYQLIKSDFGLTLYGFQIAIILLFIGNLLNVIYGYQRNLLYFKNSYMTFFIFISIIITTLMPLFNETFIGGGGFFRMEGRFLSQIFVFLLSFLIIPLAINYVKNIADVHKYIKIFLISLIILSLLGWLQWFLYNFTGIDIFPLGKYEFGGLKSGLYDFGGERLFRISSLGGEPKTLSVTLVAGFFIIHIFNKSNITFFKLDLIIKYFFLITSFVTLSTSGIVLFIVLYFVYLLINFKNIKNSFNISSKKIITLIVLFILLFSFLSYYSDTLFKLFELRVLERDISSEDFDYVVQQFLMDNPIYMILGTGLGNIHNLAFPYIPIEYKFYMDNTIFTAKSGYLKILSELGIFLFLLFLLSNFYIYLKIKEIKENQVFLTCLLIVFLLFFLTFMARTSYLNMYLTFFAILNSYQYWYFREKNHEN